MVVASIRSHHNITFTNGFNGTPAGQRQQQQAETVLFIPCSKYFLLSITSALVFVLASALYVWLEFVDLDYYWKIINIPDYVLELDDDSLW